MQDTDLGDEVIISSGVMYNLTQSGLLHDESVDGKGDETSFTWRGDAAECKGAILCPELGEGACGDFGIVIDDETQVCC